MTEPVGRTQSALAFSELRLILGSVRSLDASVAFHSEEPAWRQTAKRSLCSGQAIRRFAAPASVSKMRGIIVWGDELPTVYKSVPCRIRARVPG